MSQTDSSLSNQNDNHDTPLSSQASSVNSSTLSQISSISSRVSTNSTLTEYNTEEDSENEDYRRRFRDDIPPFQLLQQNIVENHREFDTESDTSFNENHRALVLREQNISNLNLRQENFRGPNFRMFEFNNHALFGLDAMLLVIDYLIAFIFIYYLLEIIFKLCKLIMY